MEKFRLYSFAVLSMLFWSSTFVWFKIAYENFQPFTIIFLRLLLAGVLLELYVRIFRKNEVIRKEDIKIFLLLSFCEPFCYFLGESFGLMFISATLGSLIISTIPLFTPIFTYIFLKEKLGKWGIIGLLISFSGLLFIILDNADLSGSIWGVLLEFFAVFSGIAYGIVVKKLTHKYTSITIVKVQSQLGALYFLPFFLIFDWSKFLAVDHSFSVYYVIIKLSLFGSVAAFILFTEVVKGMGPNIANMFTNLIPVFTAVFAYFILGELITPVKVIGIFTVIFGLFISQLKGKYWKFRFRPDRG
ncbi:DMT family transporter [bacterium]|nr:DMT family transporter [bacterium]